MQVRIRIRMRLRMQHLLYWLSLALNRMTKTELLHWQIVRRNLNGGPDALTPFLLRKVHLQRLPLAERRRYQKLQPNAGKDPSQQKS